MKQIASVLAGAAVMLASLSTCVLASDVTLVQDGKPMAVIVTAEQPAVAARLAAVELQHHIEQITGAVIPIVGDAAAIDTLDGIRLLGTTPEASWDRLGTEARMQELGELMDEAVRLAGTDVEQRRVATWKTGVWDYMVEGRQQFLERDADKDQK